MIPGTTVPAALVGVWWGAQVVHAVGSVGVVVATGELAGQPCAWAAFGAGINSVPEPECCLALVLAGINSVPEPECCLALVLALDLTHRPTRLEVMARLGARVGTDVGEGVLWFRMFARRTWMIDGVAGASASWSPDDDDDGAASLLPALADLDPTDDTRLPDGARVVDVRALAIVCQHVFGGAA